MLQTGSIIIKDPIFVKKEKYNFFERFFMRFLNDERDMPFVKLTFTIAAIFFPVAVFLYWPGMFNWWVAAGYLALNWAVFLGPFILMLHLTSHRSLFKKEYKFLNHTIPWIVGPFFGETPETYYVHHVTMHHLENNLKQDLSSTLHYKRDNPFHFLIYFLDFFIIGIFRLALYQIKRDRYKYLINLVSGELAFYLLCIGLSFINFEATLVVFMLPFFFTRLMMMAGNWGQHAFVDKADPGNSFKNSITCINTPYNKKCFNDGYHIGHHLRPSMHWTKLPEEFVNNRESYISEGSIVFWGLDFFMVWALLMTHSYNTLAKHYVNLDEENPKSKEEIIALLKERVRWN